MDKKFFKQCIREEVYGPYQKSKGKLTIFDRIYCKYISPESNAVYLIRKKELYESGGKIKKLLAILCRSKLVRRYGVHIGKGVTFDIGLAMPHPIGIVIGASRIGKNFKILQNCTIGTKRVNAGSFPKIGDNCTMYAGSMVIGNVSITNNVTIGANSTLVHDALIPGVYVGIPAKLLKK